MGCAATKKAKKPILPFEEQKLMKLCYKYGTSYLDNQGNEYHIIRDGNKLNKVPSLKKLENNLLYQKRVRKLSKDSQKDFITFD